MSGNSKRACNPRKVESRTLQELLQEECVPDENVLTTFNGCAWVSFCWESVEWVSCRRSNLGRHQTRRFPFLSFSRRNAASVQGNKDASKLAAAAVGATMGGEEKPVRVRQFALEPPPGGWPRSHQQFTAKV
eukprot:1013322-Prorocentrum_minimum.AAC.3